MQSQSIGLWTRPHDPPLWGVHPLRSWLFFTSGGACPHGSPRRVTAPGAWDLLLPVPHAGARVTLAQQCQ